VRRVASPLRAHAPPAAGEQDPSVMGASLCALHDLASQDPGPYRNLVPSFVSILKQVRAPRALPAAPRAA
jgi:hypothetical protein